MYTNCIFPRFHFIYVLPDYNSFTSATTASLVRTRNSWSNLGKTVKCKLLTKTSDKCLSEIQKTSTITIIPYNILAQLISQAIAISVPTRSNIILEQYKALPAWDHNILETMAHCVDGSRATHRGSPYLPILT